MEVANCVEIARLDYAPRSVGVLALILAALLGTEAPALSEQRPETAELRASRRDRSERMTPRATHISRDRAALVRASRPADNGDEIGPNDFRISDMGPDGDLRFTGINVAVAHNPDADEFLVVWQGVEDNGGKEFVEEWEIYGQFLDAIPILEPRARTHPILPMLRR